MKDDYSIVRKRYIPEEEKYEYKLIDTCDDGWRARVSIMYPGKFCLNQDCFEPGDIFFYCKTEAIIHSDEKCQEVFIVDPDSKVFPVPKYSEMLGSSLYEYGSTWAFFWDGEEARATSMIYAAVSLKVDKRKIAKALYKCATSSYLAIEDHDHLELLEYFNSWSNEIEEENGLSKFDIYCNKKPFSNHTQLAMHRIASFALGDQQSAGDSIDSIIYAATESQVISRAQQFRTHRDRQDLFDKEFSALVRKAISLPDIMLAAVKYAAANK